MLRSVKTKGRGIVACLLMAALLFGAIWISPESRMEAKAAELLPGTCAPMYRLYNPNSGEHFYTKDMNERNVLVTAGWDYEGIAWWAPLEALTADTPVWRLYNTVSGEHYYTTSLAEANHIYASTAVPKKDERGQQVYDANGVPQFTPTWNQEGIGWHSADAKACANAGIDGSELVPVYCLFNPNCPGTSPGSHHYTINTNEVDHLTAAGWRNEGMKFMGVPDQSAYNVDTNPPGVVSIMDDPGYAMIEANVTLHDTRAQADGIHAKVVIATNNGTGSAASFGIQYEKDMNKAFKSMTENTCFLMENVMDHATQAGTAGKHYAYIKPANLGTTYKLRLSWTKYDNRLHCYVNDREISSATANWTVTTFAPPFTFAVEASAERNGNYVEADFTDVKIRVGEPADQFPLAQGTEGVWNDSSFDFFGIDAQLLDAGTSGEEADVRFQNSLYPIGYNARMKIAGTANIPPQYDWDTSFQLNGHPLSGQVAIAQQQTGNGAWRADGQEEWKR